MEFSDCNDFDAMISMKGFSKKSFSRNVQVLTQTLMKKIKTVVKEKYEFQHREDTTLSSVF